MKEKTAILENLLKLLLLGNKNSCNVIFFYGHKQTWLYGKERHATNCCVPYAHEQRKKGHFMYMFFAGHVFSFEIIYPKRYRNWSNSINSVYSKYEMNL